MKNRALRHGWLAAALAASIGAAPASAHTTQGYNDWRVNFGPTSASISALLSPILTLFDGSTR